ncbi:MAG: RNA methyltransferase [Victivallaceae bacterium]|nr:RNA methyltransferase [Victivallaceae bacterium]
MNTILTSTKNPLIKLACRLRNRREREKEQLTLLEGYRELTRAFDFGMSMKECFYCPEMFLGKNELPLIAKLSAAGVRCSEVAPHLLEKMSYRDRPEGLMAIAKIIRHSLDDIPLKKNGLYLIAEAVEKPGNLGAILRSADAAGVDGVIVCDKRTDIYNPNVIRASTGALFSVPLAEADTTETIAWLKANKIKALAATPHTDSLYSDIDLTQPIAIIVGAEQYGLSEKWLAQAELKIKIPMLGKIDSLNVATAATILLYEAARQRGWE